MEQAIESNAEQVKCDQDPPKKKKRKTSDRCIVYGCGNQGHNGFFMHELPGKMPANEERFNGHQRKWLSFIGRSRKFDTKDARAYCKIIVCSGHFTKDDYESTDVSMYQNRLRTKPPSLKKDAVPTLDVALHPFPPSWFSLPPSALTTPPDQQIQICMDIDASSMDTPIMAMESKKVKRSRKESVYSRRKVKKNEVWVVFFLQRYVNRCNIICLF